MNYWQMTMEEVLELEKALKPERIYERIKGQAFYYCPICQDLVGMYSDGSVHRERGFTYKRDNCRNGHNIDWSEE